MTDETEIALVLDEGAELLGRYRIGEIEPTWAHNLEVLAWFGAVHNLLHVQSESTLDVLQQEFNAFLRAAYRMGIEAGGATIQEG